MAQGLAGERCRFGSALNLDYLTPVEFEEMNNDEKDPDLMLAA